MMQTGPTIWTGSGPGRNRESIRPHREAFGNPGFASVLGGTLAARNATRYSTSMKIKHKGLRALHEQDNRARLPADLVPRLRRILLRLQEATHPGSADAPGFRLHPLKGGRAGQWSVRVSGNWRVVFRFEDGEAADVDLVDYH